MPSQLENLRRNIHTEEDKTVEIEADSNRYSFTESFIGYSGHHRAMSVYESSRCVDDEDFKFESKVEVPNSVTNLQEDIFQRIASDNAVYLDNGGLSAKADSNLSNLMTFIFHELAMKNSYTYHFAVEPLLSPLLEVELCDKYKNLLEYLLDLER